MEIAKLTRVRLRDVWRHEAHNFTTWLENNIDLLNECLPIDLDPDTVKREESAGAFSVDLVAEDSNGNTVIIENQLEKSNHDHLGKVLTYLSSLDAKTAIWIVSDPRPEHVGAVTWLNDSNLADFYLLKIEAVQIGDSAVAPIFTLIVGPSDAEEEVQSVRKAISERGQARKDLFGKFIEAADKHVDIYTGRTPPVGGYLDSQSGYAGIKYVFVVRQNITRVMLLIERGREWVEWNDVVFRKLLEHKEEIESTFGHELQWDEKEANISRMLIFTLNNGGWKKPDTWTKVTETTVSAMLKLRKAVDPFLESATKFADQHAPKDSPTDEDNDD